DVTTRIVFKKGPREIYGTPVTTAVEDVKDMRVALPPGLIGNPEAYPKCRPADFPACPADTQVGVAKLVTLLAPELQSPVYNMEPAQGKLAQFAFSALGVINVQITADVRSD